MELYKKLSISDTDFAHSFRRRHLYSTISLLECHLLAALLDKFEGASPAFLDFKLTVALTNYPTVMQMSTWSYPSKTWHKVVFWGVYAWSVVKIIIYTGVLKGIGNLQLLDLFHRILLWGYIIFLHIVVYLTLGGNFFIFF